MLCTAKEVSRSIWWHYLIINVPDVINAKDTGFLYITGGTNHDRYIHCMIYVASSARSQVLFSLDVRKAF